MSDEDIASIGRRLAEALEEFAYTRKEDDKKEIARLHYELVKAVKAEKQL